MSAGLTAAAILLFTAGSHEALATACPSSNAAPPQVNRQEIAKATRCLIRRNFAACPPREAARSPARVVGCSCPPG